MFARRQSVGLPGPPAPEAQAAINSSPAENSSPQNNSELTIRRATALMDPSSRPLGSPPRATIQFSGVVYLRCVIGFLPPLKFIIALSAPKSPNIAI